jgi:hypothetical protein
VVLGYVNPYCIVRCCSYSGMCIVLQHIGGQWRAWRLIPGWKTLGGQRDIGWAEAVGFELLIHAACRQFSVPTHLILYGDNEGVVHGWRNGRSRNSAVNSVFRRIHSALELSGWSDFVHPTYVHSASNPADKPSRGIYPPRSLLLPPLELDPTLHRFLIDATEPWSPLELRLH